MNRVTTILKQEEGNGIRDEFDNMLLMGPRFAESKSGYCICCLIIVLIVLLVLIIII